MDFFDSLASDPKVVAVGETGLDYHYMHSPVEAQKEAFLAHLDLAETLKLPVVIHCRKAYPDLIQTLERPEGQRACSLACALFFRRPGRYGKADQV